MPRPVLGESCTTSIKDFAIFPPHKKKSINDRWTSTNHSILKAAEEILGKGTKLHCYLIYDKRKPLIKLRKQKI